MLVKIKSLKKIKSFNLIQIKINIMVILRIGWNVILMPLPSGSRIKRGLDFVKRYNMGQVVTAKSSQSSPVLNVAEGEAIGLLMTMRWAVEMNLEYVIFELDSKHVVDSILATKTNYKVKYSHISLLGRLFVMLVTLCLEYFFFILLTTFIWKCNKLCVVKIKKLKTIIRFNFNTIIFSANSQLPNVNT